MDLEEISKTPMPTLTDRRYHVGLVDDHPMVREGMGNLICGLPDIELVKSWNHPLEALDFLKLNRLDLLLLDVSLGADDGLSYITTLLDAQPDLKVVMLTVSDRETDVSKALALGAHGYLLKESDRTQLTWSIKAALRGVAVVSPTVLLSRALESCRPVSQGGSDQLGPQLSAREIQVLRLVAKGMSNKEIGQRLYLAETTVKKYSHHAMAKLGAGNRGAAAIRAVRLGLICLDDEDVDGR